jgi:hypothetical protein
MHLNLPHKEIYMKKIQSKSFIKIQKIAGSFEGKNSKSIELFDHPDKINVEYTEHGTHWPGDYMNPPEWDIQHIDIDNLDEILEELTFVGSGDEPPTLRDIGNNMFLHVASGKKYSIGDIEELIKEQLG